MRSNEPVAVEEGGQRVVLLGSKYVANHVS